MDESVVVARQPIFDAAALHARPQVLADAYHQAVAWSDQLTPAAV